MQQETPNDPNGWKRNYDIAFYVMLVHQRAIIIPLRERFGKEVFGRVCAFSFVMMCVWAAYSGDPFMWLWAGMWLVCLLKRKHETARLAKEGVRIHSQADGWPKDAIKIGGTEKAAKLVVEPMFIGALGVVLLLLYREIGLPFYGLPCFLLFGAVSLPLVEKVKQQIWERRIQGMQDARIEQEAMVQESRERFGE